MARIDTEGSVSAHAIPAQNAIRIKCVSTTSLLENFSPVSIEKNAFFVFHHLLAPSNTDTVLFFWIDNVFISSV
ncbi:hypothetical protein C7379_1263 [Hallella colorans]|uniref:Uncharacterized protein n=1 Tax=Hallella colorans TaxID=1703337 RepID=A0A2U0TXW0_9BACT|nr:hypothetical protein C7379_1263 [Hallella colorans]